MPESRAVPAPGRVFPALKLIDQRCEEVKQGRLFRRPVFDRQQFVKRFQCEAILSLRLDQLRREALQEPAIAGYIEP